MKSKPVVGGGDNFHGCLLLYTVKESAGSLRHYLTVYAQHTPLTKHSEG